MKTKEARNQAQQTVKLDTLKNIARVIAAAELKSKGVYFCEIDGVKTEVVY